MVGLSSVAVGWVFEHSPYRGATFAVHVAMGDSANDQNAHELWARQEWFATKARVTRQSVNRAIEQMVEDGFLVVLEDNSKTRKPNRYRLLMPAGLSTVLTSRVTQGDTGLSTGVTQNPTSNSTETSLPQGEPEGFEDFWAMYPRKVAKIAARAEYRKALRSTHPSDILAALRRQLFDLEARDKKFRPHPDVWLRRGHWEDEDDTSSVPREAAVGPSKRFCALPGCPTCQGSGWEDEEPAKGRCSCWQLREPQEG